MFRLSARRYDTAQCVEISHADGVLQSLTPIAERADLPWVAPGLVDLQLNGFGGIDFNAPTLTVEQVAEVAASAAKFGVTSFLPTCTTDALDALARSFGVIRRAVDSSSDLAAAIPGIHCEGPFICPEDGPRGAHPREHVRPPDWDVFARLQDAAGGLIKYFTMSPEYDAAPAFIAKAVAAGVRIAIGHTQATSDQIRAAVDAGATLSTHLGNGAHPRIKRHPNYIWDQLADDRLTASLIVDGHHLPPAVVKTMIRAKSPARIFLVSDATGLAGMPPGRYDTALGPVELLPEGKLVVAGQRDLLAGAAAMLPVCVANAVRFADLPWSTALDLAGKQPAAILGRTAELAPGAAADLIFFRDPMRTGELVIERTIRRGREVFAQA